MHCHSSSCRFPSVGKSTILSELTDTKSEVASYEFTTLTCIPGVIQYEGSRIQLLDMPGIIQGAASGKGRGRQVVAAARTAVSCPLLSLLLEIRGGCSHWRSCWCFLCFLCFLFV
jgi:small GTP-binding protein